jgi:NAD-dependent protein deacetylase/lipoamidase
VQARLAVEMPPRCAVCGGAVMKPTVVFFGEAMPPEAIAQAFELARSADLMLVVGSSLVVFPAAEIPLTAARAGVPIVLVNAEPTPYDDVAEVVIHGRSGEVLPELTRRALVASGG